MPPTLPRVPLAQLPTPLEAMPRLTQALGGPRLFVKRDDQTGLALGGNKTRKLEFLMAEALALEADTVITAGAAQSNHCRQTAAAAAKLGLRCVLVLGGAAPANVNGNLLLDHLLGADVIWAGNRPREAVLDEAAQAAGVFGHRPYVIPIGGSTPLGAVGYAAAMQEAMEQAAGLGLSFDHIVFASSSGGTHAGLVAGAVQTGFDGRVLGISIDQPADRLQALVAGLATQAAALLGRAHRFEPADINANAGYLGAGYGQLGAGEREAIRLFARNEGILLDPVYTGRAAAGMIDLVRRGELRRGESVLFWHTGGAPALPAYASALLNQG
jgi:D-cysteine desulfhydrase family pyridoxal phosphate-dependent enzyme